MSINIEAWQYDSSVLRAPNELRALSDIVKQLERDPSHRTEMMARFFESIKQEFEKAGGVYVERVNDLYRAFRHDTLIVRREDPPRLFASILEHKDVIVEPDPRASVIYPNCALWGGAIGTSGLQNAFLEGYGSIHGMVFVVAFKKGNQMIIHDIDQEKKQIFDIERSAVRRVEGVLHPADIRFVVIRIPLRYLAESELTPEELERRELEEEQYPLKRGSSVFRGFIFHEPEETYQVA